MTRLVSVAVVRGPEPNVFVADDLDTLSRLLAVEVVARLDPRAPVDKEVRHALREALLSERWGEAVTLWVRHVDPDGIDIHESVPSWEPKDLVSALDALQFRPLFDDG